MKLKRIILVLLLAGSAFAVFLLIRTINAMRRRGEEVPAPVTTKECPYCTSAIPLKASRCPECTSQLAALASGS